MLASCDNCVRSVIDPTAIIEGARVGCRGPDHNWCGEWQVDPALVPPPVCVDVPYISQSGNTLHCTMGNWEGEPRTYRYRWLLDALENEVGSDSNTYQVQPADIGSTAVCVVTATNVSGTTEAPPSNEVLIIAAF